MDFKELLSKEWVRLVGVLLIGVTIGAIFYPTRRIEEKLTIKHQEEIALLKEQHLKESTESDEKWVKILEVSITKREESEHKISKLTDEVKTLKSKSKNSTYKLVKPDGTIEERTFSESEVDESSRVVTQIQEEFKTKVEQIETRYASIHTERLIIIKKDFDSKESEYKKTIDELQKSKTLTVNEKRFGIEAGILTDKNYYGHASMDLWGPVFAGIHGEIGSNNTNKLGAGLGLRF